MSDQEDNGIGLIVSKKGALRVRSADLIRRGLNGLGQRSRRDPPEQDKDNSLRFTETEIVRMLKEFVRYLEGEEQTSRANRRLKEFEAYLRDGRAGICTVLDKRRGKKASDLSPRERLFRALYIGRVKDQCQAVAYALRGFARLRQARVAEAGQDFMKCIEQDPSLEAWIKREAKEIRKKRDSLVLEPNSDDAIGALDDIANMKPLVPVNEQYEEDSPQFSETEIGQQLKDFAQHLDEVEERANGDERWRAARANDPMYQETTYEQRKANRLAGYEAFLRKGEQGIREHLKKVRLERQAVEDHSSGEKGSNIFSPSDIEQLKIASVAFDDETYARAKPHFIVGMGHFNQSGLSVGNSMRALMRSLRENYNFSVEQLAAMKPYVIRFMQDVEGGKIDLAQKNSEEHS